MKDIIFYDAACPLCSRVVRFILKQERNKNLLLHDKDLIADTNEVK